MTIYKVYYTMYSTWKARPYEVSYYLNKETAEEVARGIEEIYDYHGAGKVEEVEVNED